MEKKSGKRKEVEEEDEVVVVGEKWRRMESELEWRSQVEMKLDRMDMQMRDGFEDVMRKLMEIRELLVGSGVVLGSPVKSG